jgi:DNA (cytosine-5)-methyltransferase 1
LSGKYRMMAPLIQQGECAANYDPGKGFQGLNRQHLDRPSNTLRKLNNGHGFTAPLHPIEHRSLSIAEAKRIGSFPDPFQLIGSFADRWSRIGNSVPPLFMRAIAGHVRDLIAPGIPAS